MGNLCSGEEGRASRGSMRRTRSAMCQVYESRFTSAELLEIEAGFNAARGKSAYLCSGAFLTALSLESLDSELARRFAAVVSQTDGGIVSESDSTASAALPPNAITLEDVIVAKAICEKSSGKEAIVFAFRILDDDCDGFVGKEDVTVAWRAALSLGLGSTKPSPSFDAIVDALSQGTLSAAGPEGLSEKQFADYTSLQPLLYDMLRGLVSHGSVFPATRNTALPIGLPHVHLPKEYVIEECIRRTSMDPGIASARADAAAGRGAGEAAADGASGTGNADRASGTGNADGASGTGNAAGASGKGNAVGGGVVPGMSDAVAVLQRCVMSAELMWCLSTLLPRKSREHWHLLYSSTVHGLHLNRFMEEASNQGPSVLVVRDKTGAVFGGYNPNDWERHTDYYGDDGASSFVFTALPSFRVYDAKMRNEKFFWCAQHQREIKNGLGFGGTSVGFHPAIFLHDGLRTGTSASTATYGNPTMTGSGEFEVDAVECWGVARSADAHTVDRTTVMDRFEVERDFIAITGQATYSEGMRDKVPDELKTVEQY